MSLLPALSWEEVPKHLTREGNTIIVILQGNWGVRAYEWQSQVGLGVWASAWSTVLDHAVCALALSFLSLTQKTLCGLEQTFPSAAVRRAMIRCTRTDIPSLMCWTTNPEELCFTPDTLSRAVGSAFQVAIWPALTTSPASGWSNTAQSLTRITSHTSAQQQSVLGKEKISMHYSSWYCAIQHVTKGLTSNPWPLGISEWALHLLQSLRGTFKGGRSTRKGRSRLSFIPRFFGRQLNWRMCWIYLKSPMTPFSSRSSFPRASWCCHPGTCPALNGKLNPILSQSHKTCWS